MLREVSSVVPTGREISSNMRTGRALPHDREHAERRGAGARKTSTRCHEATVELVVAVQFRNRLTPSLGAKHDRTERWEKRR
jgi:hypothetical protein